MPNSALYVPFWRTLADRCDITHASGDRCGMRLLVEGMACLRVQKRRSRVEPRRNASRSC